jgi:hypothetical protein
MTTFGDRVYQSGGVPVGGFLALALTEPRLHSRTPMTRLSMDEAT